MAGAGFLMSSGLSSSSTAGLPFVDEEEESVSWALAGTVVASNVPSSSLVGCAVMSGSLGSDLLAGVLASGEAFLFSIMFTAGGIVGVPSMDGEEGSVPWVFMAGSVCINVPNLRLFLGLGSSVLGLGVLGEAFIALVIGVMALEDDFDIFFRDLGLGILAGFGIGVLGEAFIALGIGVMGEAFLALEDGFDLFFRDV